MKPVSNGTELEKGVYTHRTSCQSGWPKRFREPVPPLNIYFRLAPIYPLPPRSEYLFTLYHSVAQNLFDMWRSSLESGAAELRSVTGLVPKSQFLCVNRSPVPGMVSVPPPWRKSYPVECEHSLDKIRVWRPQRLTRWPVVSPPSRFANVLCRSAKKRNERCACICLVLSAMIQKSAIRLYIPPSFSHRSGESS